MNKQTLIFFVVFLLFIGWLIKSHKSKIEPVVSNPADVEANVVNKNKLEFIPTKYDSIFKGKWKKNESLLVEYIPTPSNMFQIIDDATQDRYSTGQYIINDMVCNDSINNIFTVRYILGDDVVSTMGLRLTSDTSFILYSFDVNGCDRYTKIK